MLGAVRDSENWADLRYALVETFDIFVGVNGRLAEPFDGGRVQDRDGVALPGQRIWALM